MLDWVLRAKDHEIEAGEREALIDFFKCDIKFCSQYEEQMKLIGFNVPKKKGAENNLRSTIDSN